MKSIISTSIFCFLTLTIINIHGGNIEVRRFFSGNMASFLDSNSSVAIDSQCPLNEVYKSCGSACPPTCSRLFYPQSTQPLACPSVCVDGCFCKAGFYRAKNGRCVPPEQCCIGQNEYYSFCGAGCPRTCKSSPRKCNVFCRRGCFCKAGFIRKDNTFNSPCITPTQC